MKKYVYLLFVLFLFASCKNGTDNASGAKSNNNSQEKPNPPNPAPVLEMPTYSKDDFVEIAPPESGIEGVAPTYELPGDEFYYKGVFIPGRTVKLSPYSIGKTEVTYKLWKQVYDIAILKGYKFLHAGKEGSNGLIAGSAPSENSDHPVTNISWRDAIVWCNAYTEIIDGSDAECVYRTPDKTAVLKSAGNKLLAEDLDVDKAFWDVTKKGFRLPSEAEWEMAARFQGDGSKEEHRLNATQYGSIWLTNINSASGAKGNWENIEENVKVAWYAENAGDEGTHPVKTRKPNALGLYDMSGNVWEWCFDWYDSDGKLSMGEVTNPHGSYPATTKVYRGGAYKTPATGITVAHRGGSYAYNASTGIRLRLAKGNVAPSSDDEEKVPTLKSLTVNGETKTGAEIALTMNFSVAHDATEASVSFETEPQGASFATEPALNNNKISLTEKTTNLKITLGTAPKTTVYNVVITKKDEDVKAPTLQSLTVNGETKTGTEIASTMNFSVAYDATEATVSFETEPQGASFATEPALNNNKLSLTEKTTNLKITLGTAPKTTVYNVVITKEDSQKPALTLEYGYDTEVKDPAKAYNLKKEWVTLFVRSKTNSMQSCTIAGNVATIEKTTDGEGKEIWQAELPVDLPFDAPKPFEIVVVPQDTTNYSTTKCIFNIKGENKGESNAKFIGTGSASKFKPKMEEVITWNANINSPEKKECYGSLSTKLTMYTESASAIVKYKRVSMLGDEYTINDIEGEDFHQAEKHSGIHTADISLFPDKPTKIYVLVVAKDGSEGTGKTGKYLATYNDVLLKWDYATRATGKSFTKPGYGEIEIDPTLVQENKIYLAFNIFQKDGDESYSIDNSKLSPKQEAFVALDERNGRQWYKTVVDVSDLLANSTPLEVFMPLQIKGKDCFKYKVVIKKK